jgi:hypothetical protein
MMRLPLCGLLAVGLGLASPAALADEKAPGPAPAEQGAACAVTAEVVVLHATNDGSGIDPKIGNMPELGKPPFSAYNSYKLLERPKLCLSKGKSVTTKLPTGRDLMVSLKDVVQPSKKGDPRRFVLSASIQKPGGNTFLPLLEVNAKAGEIFFVAGQSYKGGILVLGIRPVP